MSSSYQQALDEGYTPEEIQDYFSKKNPKFQEAISEGYSPEEISQYISGKKEMPGEFARRQLGRSTARAAETVLGAPRAIGDFLEELVPEKFLKKSAGKIGLEKPVEKALEFRKKYAPHKLFPKSEDIRQNFTNFLFGKKLEPKNKSEEIADEVVSDFASLALPVSGRELKLLKPALLAIGGQTASEIVGHVGGSEKEKAWAKIGTILTGSLINPKNAKNLEKDLYSKARNARTSDASVDAKNLLKNTENSLDNLLKGDPDASSKKKSFELLRNISQKVKGGKIEIEELEQFKRDINEARSSLYENFKTDKVGRKAAKRNLDNVSKIIDKSLNEYGKENPEWEAFYRPANEVHGAIAQSQKVRNSIVRNAKKLGFPALLTELGLFHAVGPSAITGTAAALGAGAAALGGGEILARVMKSPTLRKHYMNLVNAALKDDVVVMKRNLEKLDESLKKEKD